MTAATPDTADRGTDWIRISGAIEATTYLALLTTLLWRVLADGPDLSATIGPLHGLAFAGYFVAVVQGAAGRSWGTRRVLRLLTASIIPTGGYFVQRHLPHAQ